MIQNRTRETDSDTYSASQTEDGGTGGRQETPSSIWLFMWEKPKSRGGECETHGMAGGVRLGFQSSGSGKVTASFDNVSVVDTLFFI